MQVSSVSYKTKTGIENKAEIRTWEKQLKANRHHQNDVQNRFSIINIEMKILYVGVVYRIVLQSYLSSCINESIYIETNCLCRSLLVNG